MRPKNSLSSVLETVLSASVFGPFPTRGSWQEQVGVDVGDRVGGGGERSMRVWPEASCNAALPGGECLFEKVRSGIEICFGKFPCKTAHQPSRKLKSVPSLAH